MRAQKGDLDSWVPWTPACVGLGSRMEPGMARSLLCQPRASQEGALGEAGTSSMTFYDWPWKSIGVTVSHQ